MALACPLPATLFSVAIVSRGSTGAGPAGVAGLLRWVLQRKALQSLVFSASQHLQRLQRRFASHTRTRGRRVASGCARAGGFGGVASVASAAKPECIYKSISCSATPAATVAMAARQGVAGFACSVGPVAPEVIKYPRIFNDLGGTCRSGAEIGRNGVFGARAPGSPAAGAPLGGATRRGIDLGESGHFRPSSPVSVPPAGWDRKQFQHVTPRSRLTVRVNRGAASRQNHPPRSAGDPTPRLRPAPSFVSPFGAPVGALRALSAGHGENRGRLEIGAGGAGARGQGAAKTCALVKAGSGEFSHG